MQREVSDFIVVAPAGLGKAVEWAEPMLLEYLGGKFPRFRFRIEPYGPYAEEDEFTVIPIMNADQPNLDDPDEVRLGFLAQNAVPEIKAALREFDPDHTRMH